MNNTPVAERRKADRQVASRAQVRKWINEILDKENWTATDLARKSDVAVSTVTRFMGSEGHNLSFDTLKKLVEGSGHDLPAEILRSYGARVAPPTPRQTVPETTGTVKLIAISTLPSSMQPMISDTRRVPRPSELVNDNTAFAVLMPDRALGQLVPERSVLFCTRMREPARGDLVVITDVEGVSRVRLVKDSQPDAIVLAERGSEETVIPRGKIKDFGIVRVHSRPM